MLGLNGRQSSSSNGFIKNLCKGLALFGLPGRVFKGQIGGTHFQLEDVHVPPELIDGVPRQMELECQPADFVVDEPGNSFHFNNVGVRGPNLHQ